MADDMRYTAFCGLYCRDCIPSNRALFSLAAELENKLKELRFEKYAEIKAKNDEVFKCYGAFIRILQAIRALECTAPCRQGGGKPDCEVRDCVLNNHLDGCWQCCEYRTCEPLAALKQIHPNLGYHLDLIEKQGIEGWSSKRGMHYGWQ